MSAATLTADLSKYRNFQFGSDLATVAKQAGTNPSQATSIHLRPALIQELAWRPQPLGSSSHSESANEVVFTFYNGELSRIAVNYDHYETEGMKADDFIEAISATYGIATRPTVTAKAGPQRYGEQEEVVAQWQDPQYRFDLIRSSYGPGFKLSGVLKRLEAPEQAAILEAKRLDDQEAPQRDAALKASAEQAERSQLEKARLVNKPRFRP
jgi:hypothetical protein